MLARLENAYLYILRVVVLIAATLALLAVILGLVRGITLLPNLIAPKPLSANIPGSTLGDYVTEKHAAGVAVTLPDATESPAAPPDITVAVQAIAQYQQSRNGGTVNVPALTTVLTSKQSSLPLDVQAQYGQSLKALATQLAQSKGTPLSGDQIGDLLDWHFNKFKDSADTAAVQRAAKQAQELQTLAIALSAFGVFLGLVFCFLIVKIERNLRLVRTVAASHAEAAP